MEDTRERVLALLEQVLPQIDFKTSADLIDDGILDSLSIVTMISELSMEFGIEFDMAELGPDDLNSLDAIVSLVDRLRQEQGK
jgi:acyl carrier protein